MIFHENRLSADDSHEISCHICYFWKKSGKIVNGRLLQIVGGALRVKFSLRDFLTSEIGSDTKTISFRLCWEII